MTPVVTVDAKDDGTAQLVINGQARTLSATTLEDVIGQAIQVIVHEVAAPAGGPVTVHARDPRSGKSTLSVAPTGHVQMLADQPWPTVTPVAPLSAAQEQPAMAPSPIARPPAAPVPVDAAATDTAPTAIVAPPATPEPAPASPELPTRRAARQSFLTQETAEEPAARGIRGVLTRVGIRVTPSDDERAERADAAAVSQHWPGPRTIAIVNGKGGAGKTPSTALLSAVFARNGGAGVLAWDNNQFRGTLGWRTEQGPHEATLLDLLPRVPDLMATGAQSADLAYFVHHQATDKYDVLRSKPMALADEQRLTAADVDAIHQVASKYYRLIFIDSGNDESDPLWRRMIDHTDQLVVATTTRAEHAEAGALLLEALAQRDERSAQLAQNAVVIVNQADERAAATEAANIAQGYQGIAREAATIPFDPAMVDGVLRYGALRPSTQRAWLRAAAAIARAL
jgi:MinD-like ATPase involved in chromosome partitioning or flagellar assembly